MDYFKHGEKVSSLQKQIRDFYLESQTDPKLQPITLSYANRESFTLRTKSYKKDCFKINCGGLNHVLEIDPVKKIVFVEPRVTMDELVKATLAYGLTVPVVPELKEITVGGAILGIGGESGSHQWGTFNDVCNAFEIIRGDGTLLRATPDENPDNFYGFPGSYGSLGLLVLAEIKLMEAKEFVHLRNHIFNDPFEAIKNFRELSSKRHPPDFLDGMIFSKDLAIVIEGTMTSKEDISSSFPFFSQKSIFSEFYHQHVQKIASKHRSNTYEEVMTLYEYFFRYDLGAFWTGPHLFDISFSWRFIIQELLKISKSPNEEFTKSEIKKFHAVPNPNSLFRGLLRPFMSGKRLCKMLHSAEKWIQKRMVIQDFCIPENNAAEFLREILTSVEIFPIWLLPVKGTNRQQVFAPHLLPKDEKKGLFINFGIYGISPNCTSTKNITKKLEQKTGLLGGRKILYSHSYYDREQFWKIYSHGAYQSLRNQTLSERVWHDITDKVLSDQT